MAVFTADAGSRAAAVLPEMQQLLRLIDQGGSLLQARELATVTTVGGTMPVIGVTLGNPDPGVPALGFIGGVHGLERIGAQVVLAYLGSLVRRLRWDLSLHQQLESLRLVFLPVVNPGGVLTGSRANPQGVDLMRNAPQDADRGVPFLVGGHRFTRHLPYYRCRPRATRCAASSAKSCWAARCPWPSTSTAASACVTASGSRMRERADRCITSPRSTRCARCSINACPRIPT